jgi:hypothetical protein
MKKTGLGENPLAWIKDTKEAPEEKTQAKAVKTDKSSELPKFRRYIKHTVFLSQEHLDHLHNLERAIMSKRKGGKERITKNSILRCYINALSNLDIDLRNIPDEAELLKRIKEKLTEAELLKKIKEKLTEEELLKRIREKLTEEELLKRIREELTCLEKDWLKSEEGEAWKDL